MQTNPPALRERKPAGPLKATNLARARGVFSVDAQGIPGPCRRKVGVWSMNQTESARKRGGVGRWNPRACEARLLREGRRLACATLALVLLPMPRRPTDEG